jgi:acetoin utilization deacetylase AcuC-like enzyme
MKTGFHYDPVYLQHDTGMGHPECSERLTATMHFLRQQPYFDQLQPVTARTADLEWIETVHNQDYIRRAKLTCQTGMPFLDSMDVSISNRSFEIALQAAGSAMELADRIVSGKIDNGFALIRPPGHHAENGMALGFCIFNNVAILARYLQKQHGMNKVLILDWDVHHGNGTQHTFEEDPSVFYISTHQYPYYPGTGAWYETGTGRGEGATLNCPMAAGSGDREYEAAFMEKILPAIDHFRPEMIIVSAGFDAHINDPLGNINLSTEFYGWMTDVLMEKADKYSGGRIVSLLEGGYNLKMLPRCVGEHLKKLAAAA